MFAACDGTGKLPGTHCRMDGFNREQHVRRPAESRQYVYVPHNESKPYFDMAHEWVLGRPDVPVAARRELRRAPIHHRRAGALEPSTCPIGTWGCGGGEQRLRSRRSRTSAATATRSAPCFDYQTLGDELDDGGPLVALLHQPVRQAVERRRRLWSGYQAVQAYLLRARLEARHHHAAEAVPHRRPQPASSRTSRGSRRSATTPTTSTAAAATARRGWRRSSTPSARASSGTRPRSSCSGTIGAASTTTSPPPYQGLRRPRLPRSAARDLAVREEELRLARAVRDGQRPALRRRSLRPARSWRRPTRARPRRPPTASTSSQKPRKFVPIKAPEGPKFFMQSAGGYRAFRTTMSKRVQPRSRLAAGARPAVRLSARMPALPYMQSGAALRALNATGAGQDHARRLHRAREPQLRQPLPRLSRRRHRLERQRLQRARRSRCSRSARRRQYDIDHSAEAMFAACDGTGQAARDRLPHGRLQQRAIVRRRRASPRVRLRAAQRVEAVLRHGARVGAGRPACSSRSSTRASSRTNTSSPRRRLRSVNLPTGAWGCGGGQSDHGSDDHQRAQRIRPADRSRASTTERSATSSTRPKLSWRFYASTYGSASSGGGAIWSSYQAVKHIRYGPDWKNVISPNWKFITDVRNGKLANFTWITPVCADSDHVNCGGGYGPSWVAALVNTVGKSKFWNSTAIFVQWDDWGGLYDHVPPPYAGLRRPRLPRSAARHLTLREAELRLARAVRDGQRAALRRRSLRPAISSRRPTRARRRRPQTASTSRRSRARSSRSPRRIRRSSSWVRSPTTTSRPTTSSA